MNTNTCILGLLFLPAFLLSGCTKPPTLVDHYFGTSYEYAKQSQIAYPLAGVNRQPIAGLEGSIGQRVMERYKAGYTQPAPTTETYSITVDGMTIK